MGTRNTLVDLNDHLFAELERLSDEKLTKEKMEQEIARAKAISSIAENVIDNAAIVLKAVELSADFGRNEIPRLLVGDSPDKKMETDKARDEMKRLMLRKGM